MELKEGTIKHLQEYIAYKIKERGFDDESLHERLLLLCEEVGELIHACRKISGMHLDAKRAPEENPGEEIVDVLHMLFATAEKLGIDVERELLEKDMIVDQRQYTRFNKKTS